MKKNTSLILGLSIPILMVLFVAISIYLPRQFSKPGYDFLYIIGTDTYYSEYTYSVENGVLTREQNNTYQNKDLYYSKPLVDYGPPKIYIYSIENDLAREISFEEAQAYKLDNNAKSPDGFEISRGSGAEIVPFSGSYDYNSQFIRNGNYSKKLNIQVPASSDRYYDFRLLGWVIK